MGLKLILCIVVIAAVFSRSAGYPLASGTVRDTRTRASRSAASHYDTGSGIPTEIPENTQTDSSKRTSSGAASYPSTGQTTECNLLETEQLAALAKSIHFNVKSIDTLAKDINKSILGSSDVDVSVGLYPDSARGGSGRLSYEENLYGKYLGRSVNYLRCFLRPIHEALGNDSHTEVFTNETNYWTKFYYIFGNLTEAARDMEALVLGMEDRPGVSGCEVPSLDYPCNTPTVPSSLAVTGLTDRQLLQAGITKELNDLAYDILTWPLSYELAKYD